MSKLMIGFGIGLIALGVGAYVVSGQSSLTALIPAMFGVLLTGCGLLARRDSLLKGVSYVAILIAAWGCVETLRRAWPTLDLTALNLATGTQLGLAIGLLLFVVLAVRLLWRRRSGAGTHA